MEQTRPGLSTSGLARLIAPASPLRLALLALPVLVAASIACLALLEVRERETGNARFHFMVWNLFLAWLPFVFASLAVLSHALSRRAVYAVLLPLAGAWLLFLPNAPYLLTDLIHVRHRDGLPFLFDATMFATFAATGLLLGLVSLRLMQHLVADLFGGLAGWLFAIGALGLSAVGVYLGRVLRWNSWDAVLRPEALLGEVWQGLRDPFSHDFAVVFTASIAAFLVASYALFFAVSHLASTPALSLRGAQRATKQSHDLEESLP